jgi:hypothetical protein
MVSLPIHVQRKNYGGRDSKKRAKIAEQNRVAGELEKYINGQIEEMESGTHTFLYGYIAHDTEYDEEMVRKLCFSIDCGHNGFTVTKP